MDTSTSHQNDHISNTPSTEALLAKVTYLEQQVAAQQEQLQAQELIIQAHTSIFHKSNIPISIIVQTPKQFIFAQQNSSAMKLFDMTTEETNSWLAGRDEGAMSVINNLMACWQSKQILQAEYLINFPDRDMWLQSIYSPILDEENNVVEIVKFSFDITERKIQEQEELQRHEMMIAQQSSALQELSTPILAINESTVIMPLIGAIDSQRAQLIMDTLLSDIAHTRATIVIMDITGVSVVDTQVANVFIRTAQAVRLLGANVVITGIRPEIAQTLVGLGVELGDIITRSTLQMGIAYALNRKH
jgi:anti-anti-sigma factor